MQTRHSGSSRSTRARIRSWSRPYPRDWRDVRVVQLESLRAGLALRAFRFGGRVGITRLACFVRHHAAASEQQDGNPADDPICAARTAHDARRGYGRARRAAMHVGRSRQTGCDEPAAERGSRNRKLVLAGERYVVEAVRNLHTGKRVVRALSARPLDDGDRSGERRDHGVATEYAGDHVRQVRDRYGQAGVLASDDSAKILRRLLSIIDKAITATVMT